MASETKKLVQQKLNLPALESEDKTMPAAKLEKEEGQTSEQATKDPPEDISTSSSQTAKAKTKSHHYNDTEEEASWTAEDEDEVNTVSSDKTSRVTRKNGNKLILPKFTRYQMMILLDQGEASEMSVLDDKDKDKSPSQRIREFLVQFVAQTKKADKDSKIMSWKTDSNFTYMDDSLSNDIAEISRYFNGYRKNFKADKRVYLWVAIHTPNSESRLRANLVEWMRLYGYIINKCIIQAESSTCIGWLVYSSQHTDTEIIKELLTNESNFEWGFKMVSVTEADSNLPWLQRARAVGIYVPTPFKDIAVNIVGKAFEASMDSQVNVPDLTDKFLFMEPERMYKGSKNKEIYYAKMVERHKIHNDSLVAEPSYAIQVDLDKIFNVDPSANCKEFKRLCIRDILLDLKVETPDHPMYGTNLFHSVDYFSDSSNLWLNGEKCDGNACCVFTYYEVNASEASTMVKGMGKMVLKEFGEDTASEAFSLNHFKGNSGYRWSTALRRFSTPALRRMKANKSFDHNLPAITVLMQHKRQKELEEEKKKQREAESLSAIASKKSKQSLVETVQNPTATSERAVTLATNDSNIGQVDVSATLMEDDAIDIDPVGLTEGNENNTDEDDEDSRVYEMIKTKQLQKLVSANHDKDLNDLDDRSTASNKPYDIDLNDNNSIASSLTNLSSTSTVEKISGASRSDISADDVTFTTKKTRYGISESVIEKMAKEGVKNGMTSGQLEEQVQRYQALKFNEAKNAASAAVAKFLKNTTLPIAEDIKDSISASKEAILSVVSPTKDTAKHNVTGSTASSPPNGHTDDIGNVSNDEEQAVNPPSLSEGPPTSKEEHQQSTEEEQNTSDTPSSQEQQSLKEGDDPSVSSSAKAEVSIIDRASTVNTSTTSTAHQPPTRKKRSLHPPTLMSTRSMNVRQLRSHLPSSAGDGTPGWRT